MQKKGYLQQVFEKIYDIADRHAKVVDALELELNFAAAAPMKAIKLDIRSAAHMFTALPLIVTAISIREGAKLVGKPVTTPDCYNEYDVKPDGSIKLLPYRNKVVIDREGNLTFPNNNIKRIVL